MKAVAVMAGSYFGAMAREAVTDIIESEARRIDRSILDEYYKQIEAEQGSGIDYSEIVKTISSKEFRPRRAHRRKNKLTVTGEAMPRPLNLIRHKR